MFELRIFTNTEKFSVKNVTLFQREDNWLSYRTKDNWNTEVHISLKDVYRIEVIDIKE